MPLLPSEAPLEIPCDDDRRPRDCGLTVLRAEFVFADVIFIHTRTKKKRTSVILLVQLGIIPSALSVLILKLEK